MSRSRVFAAVAAALLALAPAAAQEKLQVEGPDPGIVRVGEVARVNLSVEGRGADPRPPRVPQVDGLRMELSGPSTASSFQSDGRNMTQRVVVTYHLALQPLREGVFVVPAFRMWTGSREQEVRQLRIEAKKDLLGEQLGRLEVQIEPRRVYVHEPIRVHVDADVHQGVRLVQGRVETGQLYFDVEVQASWLDEFPGGERIDVAPPSGNATLIVRGNRAMLAALDENHERDGKRWRRFSFDRAFLPTRIGRIELPAATLRYHVLRREGQRDLFGLERGGLTENYYARSEPVTIEVLPIPEEGRPTPYFGAVGRFTIDATLDRDSVRVGSSVKLTLTVRGQGNLEFLRLPALDDLPGFHKLGQAEAKRDADKVVVTYDLTPLTTDVREIPAIGWNWFDTTPGVEKFVEVKTRALPLQVLELPAGETLAPLPTADAKLVTPGKDDIFDLPPFDGAPALRATPAPWLSWLAVLGPWLAAGLGLFAFRKARARAADVVGQRARAAARACLAALQRGDDALAALAGYLGDRLGVPPAAIIAPDLARRLEAAGIDAAVARELEALVAQGTAARYGGGAQLDAAAVRAAVARLERTRLPVRTLLPWLLLPVLAAGGCGQLWAQGPVGEGGGVEAYRRGDYEAADAAFARAFAATGDRRCLQARGNCFVRANDLPRALWAYASARLGRPRDPELLANLAFVRARLDLPAPASGFDAELASLRERMKPGEQLLLCALCMAVAAGCLVIGWRRVGLRWVGVLFAMPGIALAVELLWLAPNRPPQAIALEQLAIVSEPRAGLEPVATVRPGASVDVLGGSDGTFVRVQAGDRGGYVRRECIAAIE